MTKIEYDKKMAELTKKEDKAYKVWYEVNKVLDEACKVRREVNKEIDDLEESWAEQESERNLIQVLDKYKGRKKK